jgi:hypothetical protein
VRCTCEMHTSRLINALPRNHLQNVQTLKQKLTAKLPTACQSLWWEEGLQHAAKLLIGSERYLRFQSQ